MKPYRDVKHSTFIKRFEFKRLCLKKVLNSSNSVINQENVTNDVNTNIFFRKYVFMSFFSKFSTVSSKRSFCFFTKRTRSVLSKFKCSRIAFRELASFCKLNGVRKSSW
jgi:ribosomal protein S14